MQILAPTLKEAIMLLVDDTEGRHRIISHVHANEVPMLKAMAQRFDHELALWDAKGKEWVNIGELDLETAREFQGDVL